VARLQNNPRDWLGDPPLPPPPYAREIFANWHAAGCFLILAEAGLYLGSQGGNQTLQVPTSERRFACLLACLEVGSWKDVPGIASSASGCAASDTRDAFVEPRPGSKKISRKLIIPLSPASRPPSSSRVPSSSIPHPASTSSCDIVRVSFASRQIAAPCRPPGRVRSRCRIITLPTRLAVLYKQIYGPRGRTPRVWKTHTISSGNTESHSLHSPYLLSPSSSSSLRPIFRPAVNRQFPITAPRCSSVSCTYPGIDVGGFKLRRLISCDQPSSGSR
jgi:hypothetical protein